MNLALTLALLTVQENAEELFQRLAKKYDDGPCLSVKIKGTISGKEGDQSNQTEIVATARLKTGDKSVIEMTVTGGISIKGKSDGKREISEDVSGKKDETPTKEGYYTFVVGGLTRAGFTLFAIWTSRVGDRRAEKKMPDLGTVFKPSGFALGTPEKIGEVDAKVVEYTLAVEEIGDFKVKLWLDGEKLVPLKRVCTKSDGGREVTITETYEEISTADIPDAEFEHQK